MQVIDDAWNAPGLAGGAVGTIGNFDGVHRGQQAILEKVIGRAGELRLPAVVVTFEPHPLVVLSPQEAPRRLTTVQQKVKLLTAQGVDTMAVVRFTPEFSETPADVFVSDYLHGKLGLREVYVGSRFAFGRRREGDLRVFKKLAAKMGFECHGVDEIHHDGHPVSSTRIRRAVTAGRVETARVMLGRPYALGGAVVAGDGRGKELGWPTMNLEPENEILPADGVYASRVVFSATGDTRDGVSNVGRRPTFDGDRARVVECHIFDFDREIYGERVELSFLSRLRGERVFTSGETLTEQIAEDARQAREYLAAQEC
jgi:riboflavin kinase/FMN adenylyltransferase